MTPTEIYFLLIVFVVVFRKQLIHVWNWLGTHNTFRQVMERDKNMKTSNIMKTERELQMEKKLGFPVDTCDWCTFSYPKSVNERFYYLQVVSTPHKICGDCFDRLVKI